jgi:hypothetical protein
VTYRAIESLRGREVLHGVGRDNKNRKRSARCGQVSAGTGSPRACAVRAWVR